MDSFTEKKAKYIYCLVAVVVAVIINHASQMSAVIIVGALGYAAYLKLSS